MIRIIFMGTPEYAADILETLIKESAVEIVAVYTQPDKPVGRKAIITPPLVKVLAQASNIPVFQPTKLRDTAVVEELLSIACDMIIVAAYGQILPKSILEHAPCVNLHASILPKYRGASPIQQSLLNNDTQSGATAMWMDEGLDTGAIIKISTLEIGHNEMIESLYARLTKTASELTLDIVHNWDRQSCTAQKESDATHCTKITKVDGLIRFDNAEEIFNRYRAFTPWPGIYLESGLKIKEMRKNETHSSGNAGEIIAVDEESVTVQCLKGSLRLIKVQASSKQETSAVAYLNGKRLVCGNTLV
ncbi:MAG: methionyl-tRNA formyltransferase [Campylobacterota bacterium]|nr:methionyl-tRNA formyltransferase [Campylobacterota bacterium]